MKEFLIRFVRCFVVLVFITLAASGILLLVKARGSSVAVAQDPFWGLAKWWVLDLHVVLGVVLLPLAVLAPFLRVTKGARNGAPGTRKALRAAAPVLAALVATYLLAQFILDAHPVLIEDQFVTAHPASHLPDQIVLTCSGDPRNTMTVQWRSEAGSRTARLRYREASASDWRDASTHSMLIEDTKIINDASTWKHESKLTDLTPGTAYAYQVGNAESWGASHSFTTAPADAVPFSFVYMGDVQNGFDEWGKLREAMAGRTGGAFTIIAGDLVSNGGERQQWDDFFYNAGNLFAERPLYPCLGNHDNDHDDSFDDFLTYFDLPKNGPAEMEAERAYTFQYSNAFFVVLDSNLDPETQTEWLDAQLAQSTAQWKIPIFHHPVYSSKASRDNPEIRAAWAPLFEKHGVRIVLQGHDHAYMRTHPMRDGKEATPPDVGISYIVTVAGTKYYDQDDEDYIAVGIEELSTYQVIDIDGGRLRYTAYDIDGKVVDELEIVQ